MRTVWGVTACALLLSGCSRGSDVKVVFGGMAPTNAFKESDTRFVEFRCPGCGKKLDVSAGEVLRCPDVRCGAKISWALTDRLCGYCGGGGKCPACVLMNQDSGECYNCRGRGYLTMAGKTNPCRNCGGSKKCPVCKGKNECVTCAGQGRAPLESLKSLVKSAPAPEAAPATP